MKLLSTCALVAGLLLAGCATEPANHSTNPLDATAKQFTPPPGLAGLYVSREGDLAGNGTTLEIRLDGRLAGTLPPGTYQWLTTPPGDHVLNLNVPTTEVETLAPAKFKDTSRVPFTAEAGKNYFFRATLHLGWSQARLNLSASTPAQGRKDVLAAPMATTQNGDR